MQFIRLVFRRLYFGEFDKEEAAKILSRNMSKQELAEFIVDAYSRGWITNFNLGIDEADDNGNVR